MHRIRRILGVILLLALTFFGLWWLQHDHDQRTRDPAPRPTLEPKTTPAHRPAHPHSGRPLPGPTVETSSETGQTGILDPAAEEAMLTTAGRFVDAWLIPDPDARGLALQPYTTPELLEGLVNTRPDKIPYLTPNGPPALVRIGPWGAEARQRFTDNSETALLIVPHPSSPTQWVVASVRKP